MAASRDTWRVREPKGEAERLVGFLSWMLPLVLGFAVLTTVARAVFADSGLVFAGVILGCYGALLLLARELALRGRLGFAVAITCAGMFVAALVMSLTYPEWASILVVAPLLAVAVALPYVRDRPLLWLILLAWTVTVVIVALGRALPSVSNPPGWFTDVFVVCAASAAVALVLFLLRQFSTRLNDTLAETRAAEERYALAERGANDGLWDWDLASGKVYYSARWKEMLGFSEDEVGDDPGEWFSRVHPDDSEVLEEEVRSHLEGRRANIEVEYRIHHENGGYLWVLCRGIALRDAAGEALRLSGSQTDITRRKEAEERLIHDAFHDPLTGLPNRALFLDGLRRALKQGTGFAVLYMDLDNFKAMNDSLGHEMGDALLVAVAGRLRGILRPSDVVARLGGDEFAVLLGVSSGIEEAERVAERLLEELQSPVALDGRELYTTASIGIVLGDAGHRHPEEILRDADTAMYRAKELGRSRKSVFERRMRSRAVALFDLETGLRRAMEREEFIIHYQPIVSLGSGGVVGFEALIRWRHPERGLLSPSEFIPTAEETGLILSMESFVLREAAHQAALWRRRFPERPPSINVNLSRDQLARPGLAERIRQVLEETSLDPRALRMEITESVLMQDVEYALSTLACLRELDVQIQIDDFGTGYSSLSALHSFPIDSLKVDRSFIGEADSGNGAEIVRTIITLAHNLNLDVIAEGVETESHLDALRHMGCDYGQGFLFSGPLDGTGAERLLEGDPRW